MHCGPTVLEATERAMMSAQSRGLQSHPVAGDAARSASRRNIFVVKTVSADRMECNNGAARRFLRLSLRTNTKNVDNNDCILRFYARPLLQNETIL